MVKNILFKQTLLCSIIALLLFAAACKKDSATSYSALPVVEAYLMPNKKIEIRVSLQKQLVDTNAYGTPITGLTLQLYDGSSTRTLTEDKAGHYILDETTYVKSKGVYNLSFTYNGLPVSASTTVPDKPSGLSMSADTVTIPKMVFGTDPTAFIPVYVNWSNAAANNHIVVFKYQETWKSLISNRFNSDTVSSVEVNAVKAASYELSERTFRYYGRYMVILMRVNQEYLDMLNSSSTSSQNLTNAPSNVTNGLGIFTAMEADTLATRLLVKAED